MDVYLKKQLYENSVSYKMSLDRIIDKYSKLQYRDGGIEVDLDNTKPQTLEHYMRLSKIELNKLESKSITDVREESLRAQDITRNSQLDFTHENCGADETPSTTHFSEEDDGETNGTTRSDTTQMTVSSLDESQRNFSETELQPEDQDEELEMSLRNHGSTLVELYPSMISRIERAWHRKNVSEAADLVLRRYRRWRQQSNRSNLNNTFNVTLRHTNSNPKQMTSKTLLMENSISPQKRQFTRIESAALSPLQTVTNLQDWEAQQQSPRRERGSQRTEQHQPILAMDLSCLSETSKIPEISLNETFTVSELTQLEQPSTASPSRSYYPTAKASLDRPLRSRRLSLSAHSEQAAGCSMFASETIAVKERPDIYSSPVRQSPLKARLMTSLSGSPHAFSRSPKEYPVESFSRETLRPRSMSTSLSSPSQKPNGDMRMLYPLDSNHSLQLQLRSPQSATAGGRHRLRRHLSFDSSQPSSHVSYSPKTLDQDFRKLYHKFVCQNKSFFFNSPPCRLCAGSSEANRGHSSSALAALALSPHRSVLRKRHRELGLDSHPQSKRFREEYCTSSPGSKRNGKEMLRRSILQSELEQSHDDLSHRSSKLSMFQKVSIQRRSADAHQEAWTSWGRPLSVAEFSGLGGTFESGVANGYSPRKC